MKFIIEVSNQTRHIVDAQKYLFKKYAPDARLQYIDLGNEPIARWCKNVHDKIVELNLKDKHIVFGLADFLPIDRIGNIIIPQDVERLELGRGARSGKPGLIDNGFNYLRYSKETPYKNSCQFSIWKVDALLRELKRIRTSPWDFETSPTETKAACLKKSVFRYIEESAVSGRRKGLINLCGLRLDDINELIDKGFVDKNKIIYGWKGTANRTLKVYGTKYKRFY